MGSGGAVRVLPPLQGDLIGRQLGRYQVLGQIAAGGMAGVYVARAHGVAGFERLVAIKVLHPHLAYEEEFISMFLDEARLAARIRHPNVVATLDVSDTSGGGYFLVMDYIEGVNLATLLRHAIDAEERLPEPVVLRIVCDGLAGLGAAHELTDERGELLSLVHRDVSPHNVMVGVDGIARLTDFGVASASKRLTSTRQGTFKGKISYSSPEQALQRPVDGRADLFAMGIVLWECLTSRRLFRAEDESGTLQRLLHDPIPLPSSVSPDLTAYDAVLGKALEREPGQRFQTALEFIEALETLGKPIARARTVGEEVRQRASERLAQDATQLQRAVAALGTAPLAPAAPPAPRIYDPDVPTVAAPESTHVTRRQLPARTDEASASQRLTQTVRRRPLTVVGIILVLAVAVVAMVISLSSRPELGERPTRPRPARPAAAEVRDGHGGNPRGQPETQAEAPAPDPVPEEPPRAAAPSTTGETTTGRGATKGPSKSPTSKRRAREAAPAGDPDEILVNPYRR